MNTSECVQWREASIKALIPFAVFVLFYFGFALITKDFSKVPMTAAFIVSSAAALMLNRKECLSKKIELFALGMGNKDIMIMCLIFILAGAFAVTAQAAGGAEAAVNIARHFVPAQFMVFGLFVISALISLSIGTSCGTIAAIVPIAVSIAQNFGLNPSIVLGAAVGGAMFGDNMSLISDTTIAASRTQNVEMRDEMFANFKIIWISALLCLILYLLPVFSSPSVQIEASALVFDNFIKASPYVILLILGILGFNVLFLLLLGIILNTAIGISYGIFDIFDAFSFVGTGIGNMSDTLIVAMLAGGLLILVKYNGGIGFIINKTARWIKNRKTCEIGICFLTGAIDFFTANNTVAIIIAGPIAKELSEKYNIPPVRTASLLDTSSCIVQGIIPYGAQILIAVSLSSAVAASPFTVMQGLFYPLFMLLGLALSIMRTKEEHA